MKLSKAEKQAQAAARRDSIEALRLRLEFGQKIIVTTTPTAFPRYTMKLGIAKEDGSVVCITRLVAEALNLDENAGWLAPSGTAEKVVADLGLAVFIRDTFECVGF